MPDTSPANGAPSISPPDGRLAVFCVGLGAVATTLIAGVEAVRGGEAVPIGSLSQMGTVRLGRRDEGRVVPISQLVPLTALDDMDFCTWDPYEDDAYVAALRCGVIDTPTLERVGEFLRSIQPRTAVFDNSLVTTIGGPNVKGDLGHRAAIEALRADISAFMEEKGSQRAVMVWTGSTEAYRPEAPEYLTLDAFESALDSDAATITPTMLYAYSALGLGIPFINCSPNLSDIPALAELASARNTCVAGKDLKTGQTMVKTVLAPMLKARMLGLQGWYSTNILGNRDGEVLQAPENFYSKQQTKLGVLEYILEPDLYPELYGDIHHQVSINYYPPRGDNKEGWDNIDITGWLGYQMQLKVNFLCRDSILAAPLVLDLVLFSDLAQRAGMRGIQEWLSFYFKAPQCAPSVYPEHDLFIQQFKLKNTLRFLGGEEPLTHLGLDYYDYF